MITKKLKVLIVDDTLENRQLLKIYMRQFGHEFVLAENGQQAIDIYKKENPDIILMDVMMPVLDGYKATVKIRELCGSTWVPIIFLSANEEVEDQVKGINAGGDDYLSKPINVELLKAKIRAFQRIAEMQSQLNDYHIAAQSELELARKLVDNMTHHEGLNDPALNYWFKSAEQLSGDLITASRTIDDKLYVMAADATGHGLVAAMSQLPVSQSFYEMTRRGYSISSIVASINEKLANMLTVERYVSAIIASIDFKNKIIEVWNGAGPDAYFVSSGGEVLHTFKSTECALGIVNDGTFNIKTEIYQWQESGELLLFSDGLLDVVNNKEEMYGEDKILEVFARPDSSLSWFQQVKHSIKEYFDIEKCFDDISLVSVNCLVDVVELKKVVNQ